MRYLPVLLVALVFPATLQAQEECGADWGSGTGSAFAYWVTADDAQRSRHTNLATALSAMADSIRARPAAEWRVRADFLGEWRGPCASSDTVFVPGDSVVVTDTIFQTDTVTVTDTVEVELPPDTVVVTDTVEVELPPDTVEVCPDGWTCTPPADTVPEEPADTTAAAPDPLTSVNLMGWVTEGGGAILEWDPADADSVVAFVAMNRAPWTELDRVTVPGDSTRARLTVGLDTVAAIFACGIPYRDGLPPDTTSESLGQRCDKMDAWAPLDSVPSGPSYTIQTERLNGPPVTNVDQIAVGDSFHIHVELQQRMADGTWESRWADSSAAFPDSVIFLVNGERHRERVYPYEWQGDGGVYVVPAVDTVDIHVWIYGEGLLYDGNGDGELFLGAAWPLGFGTGDVPDDSLPPPPDSGLLSDAAQYWAENVFQNTTGTRLYYVGSNGPDDQAQYALGNERGILYGWRASYATATTSDGAHPPCHPTKGVVVAEYPPVDDTADPKIPWCP